ncbi:MAG: chloride channel protein [Flavobacteriaceae bacterium]
MNRKKVQRKHYFRLIGVAALIGVLSSLLAYSLKTSTEYIEEIIFEFISHKNRLLFVLLPTIGITAIYFLRKYIFANRRNKGITEIYKTLDQRKDHLPFFKIPSHYINGFLTVIFGGSTGIEVSTVVASATIGNQLYKKDFSAKIYKRELICAGVCAGVAILFGSPLAGWLFAMEVIARKFNLTLFLSCTASALVAWAMLHILKTEPIIPLMVNGWEWKALPFMMVLSLLGGLLSIYFTVLVTRIKRFFSGINNNFIRVNLGALAVGTMICFFPLVFGDSYHALREMAHHPTAYSLVLLLGLALVKPLAAALTLGAGGDGGVFAPGIVAGAFLGLAFALFCNNVFGTSLVYFNFMLIGGAATLSASIYAPFTALFITCNLVPNGFTLFFPILVGSLTSNYFAKWLFPYNVYTYDMKAVK